MTFESEWDGFTTMASSGIAEALYQAGVDSRVADRPEQYAPGPVEEGDAG